MERSVVLFFFEKDVNDVNQNTACRVRTTRFWVDVREGGEWGEEWGARRIKIIRGKGKDCRQGVAGQERGRGGGIDVGVTGVLVVLNKT